MFSVVVRTVASKIEEIGPVTFRAIVTLCAVVYFWLFVIFILWYMGFQERIIKVDNAGISLHFFAFS